MTHSSHEDASRRETPLQEGLRRYAPKNGEGRRVAVSDFLISLLDIYRRSGGNPRI
jgi:hypothetical protein